MSYQKYKNKYITNSIVHKNKSQTLSNKSNHYDKFVSSEKFCYHRNFKSNEIIRGLHQQDRWKTYEKIYEYYKIEYDNGSIYFGNIKKGQIEGFGIYCSFDFSGLISKLNTPKDTKFNIDSFYKNRIKRDKLNYSSEKIFSFCYIGNFKYGNFHDSGTLHTYFKGSHLKTLCNNWKVGFEHKRCTIRHNNILIAENEKFSMGTHDRHRKTFINHQLYKDGLSYLDLSDQTNLDTNFGFDKSELFTLNDIDFSKLIKNDDSKYINSQERISNHESGKLDDQVKQYQIALGIAD